MKYKCEKCEKEYVSEKYYKLHIEKCEVEIKSSIKHLIDMYEDEEASLYEDDELVYDVQEGEDRMLVEIKMDILGLFDKLGGIVPKDQHTKAMVIRLYNQYYGYELPEICVNCQFEQIFSSLKRVYSAIKSL